MSLGFPALDGEPAARLGRGVLVHGGGRGRPAVARPDAAGGRGASQALDRGPPRASAAAQEVGRAWPDQYYEALAIVALHRPGGLTEADHAYARRLSDRIAGPGRPGEVLRVLGPRSEREIAERLVSRDGTVQLMAVHLGKSFVSPATQEAVAWLEAQASAVELAPPGGLEVHWSGDAVIGRDYMANVQTSLDRAALATVVLLLVVLLVVYRSIWLALVPLVTIGVSLVIARGVLAWMIAGGVGDLAAGRAVPGGDPVRQRDRLLPVHLVAVRRALQPGQPGRGDAGDAPPGDRRAADQRRDGDRRPVADGDDQVQALLVHRPERRDRPGADAGGDPDADPRAAGPAGPVSPPVVRGPDGAVVGVLGPVRPQGAGPAAAELGRDGPGDGPARRPRAADDDRSGHHHRAAGGESGGEHAPLARDQVRAGDAHPA